MVHTLRKRCGPDHLHRGTGRQEVCAVCKICLCARGNAQNAQLEHSSGESGCPLALLADEAGELLADSGVLLAEVDVGVEARDAGARRHVVCLTVVVDVPLAGSAVLGSIDGDGSLGQVCACGVSADQSRELGCAETLVEEELQETVVIRAWAEAWGHLVGWCWVAAIGAANDGLDLGTTWTGDDCDTIRNWSGCFRDDQLNGLAYLEAN